MDKNTNNAIQHRPFRENKTIKVNYTHKKMFDVTCNTRNTH